MSVLCSWGGGKPPAELFGSGSFFPPGTFRFSFEDGFGRKKSIPECPAVRIELSPDGIPFAGGGSDAVFVELFNVGFELSRRDCELSSQCVRVESHCRDTFCRYGGRRSLR